MAVNDKSRALYHGIDVLHKSNSCKKFWNIIKKSRTHGNECGNIDLTEFEEHFGNKFSDDLANVHTAESSRIVNERLRQIESSGMLQTSMISENSVKSHIRALQKNKACGLDGIYAEHLKKAADTCLPLHLACLLTMCLRSGEVPECFTQGLLLPIHKVGKDSNNASSYRPITISSVPSKILELHILSELSSHTFNSLQFGFIQRRGTAMATTLAHDLIKHTNSKGSTIFACSLDAQGAFDHIPHDQLFRKCIGVLSDASWYLIYGWYKNMSVRIKWNNKIGETIKVARGTRQGGLTSPTLFNIFYQELVSELEFLPGVSLGGRSYSVLNYADDLLLLSTTSSGLQKLLDSAARIIGNNGLNFNPQKTQCTIFGRNPFITQPVWTLDEIALSNTNELTYLGTVLGNDGGKSHAEHRIRQATRAFYGLQAVGMCKNGIQPNTAAFLYKSIIQPTLLFGMETISTNKAIAKSISTKHGNLIKTVLGLNFSAHTTPILSALNIPCAAASIKSAKLKLLYQCITSDNAARDFYLYMYKTGAPSQTLLGCCRNILNEYHVPLNSFITSNSTRTNVLNMLKEFDVNVGVTDSVKYLLNGYNYEKRIMLSHLLQSY